MGDENFVLKTMIHPLRQEKSMKKIVLINGLLAAIIIAGVSTVFLWRAGPDAAHSQSEWLGYLIMLVGLAFIFVAIKQHRDNNLGGVISFVNAFQIGLLVTLIAALFYVAAWEAYYQNAGQGFIETYQQSYMEQLQSDGATAEELAVKKQEMNEFTELYDKLYFRAMITLLEILPVGLLMTLLAAFLLKTKKSQ
jgi:hypothetical protein